MRDSDWSRPNLLRSDWLPTSVAMYTTAIPLEPVNKVEQKTEASKCTTRGIHKQEMLKLGNGNLKDRAVL